MNTKNNWLFFLALILLNSCQNETTPKPTSYLKLEYPNPEYEKCADACGFLFAKNKLARVKKVADCGLEIQYPKMKATIFITYKNVSNNIDSLLRDAQTFTYKHSVKANEIAEQPYVNLNSKVYGMFYQVAGNAATNAQLYATDSTKNFVTASMYFYSKPNYDSILPAADYLKNDMKKLIETITWK